jgi:DNA-binding transcriptional LysR family regulator
MMNNVEPSLDELSIFLAVCKAGGFRAAAKLLGLSASHVSETVTRIEAQLGVPLLSRTTRSVMPTAAGRELAERIAPLFSEARAALLDVANAKEEVRGLLKLNVGTAMVDVLAPLIDDFLAAHPAVRVELVINDRLVDIIAAGCDAGIRYGKNLSPGMIAVPIGPRFQHLALAASPAYVRRRGMPSHPAELLEHDCIRIRFSSGTLSTWTFERDGEVLTIDPPSRLIVGVQAAEAAVAYACAGHGLVCTLDNWLLPHIQRGKLTPVLQDWWHQIDGPWMYFPSRLMPAPLRAFVDLMAGKRQQAGLANQALQA